MISKEEAIKIINEEAKCNVCNFDITAIFDRLFLHQHKMCTDCKIKTVTKEKIEELSMPIYKLIDRII